MKMTTTTRHPFGGGFRSPGDEFEATEQEAPTFESLGWAKPAGKGETAKPAAKPAPAKAAKKATGYTTRALKARK